MLSLKTDKKKPHIDFVRELKRRPWTQREIYRGGLALGWEGADRARLREPDIQRMDVGAEPKAMQ